MIVGTAVRHARMSGLRPGLGGWVVYLSKKVLQPNKYVRKQLLNL